MGLDNVLKDLEPPALAAWWRHQPHKQATFAHLDQHLRMQKMSGRWQTDDQARSFTKSTLRPPPAAAAASTLHAHLWPKTQNTNTISPYQPAPLRLLLLPALCTHACAAFAAAVARNTAPCAHAAAPQHQLSRRLPVHSPTIWVVAEVRHRDAAGSNPKRTQLLHKLNHQTLCNSVSAQTCVCVPNQLLQGNKLLLHWLQAEAICRKLWCTQQHRGIKFNQEAANKAHHDLHWPCVTGKRSRRRLRSCTRPLQQYCQAAAVGI
jgi:hypothetical protein